MRNRWEKTADEGLDLDEPVTLTARQLRSLKWGARAGLFALVLAIAATGLAGWAWFQGSKQESGTNSNVASATEQAAPADSRIAEAATTAPAGAPGSAAPGSAPSPAAGAPAIQPAAPAAQTSAPAKAAPAKAAPRVTRSARHVIALPPAPKSAAARAQKPVTENFGASTTEPAPTPTPSPMPVSAEPAKPVAQDSSAAH